ncbi:MAG: glucan phosphoethanolaminetransferase (alkaline phosphatase superfamily) [Kiritimatiellia bacterium]|jgi:glucan phosphoethanolaminetransferase (alkaline phosphatase superfamily)
MQFLKILLATHIAVGIAFIFAFQQVFQYSPTIVILHALLVFASLAFVLLPCLFLHQRSNHKAMRTYLLIALPVFDFILLLIYSSSVISNLTWSGNITLQLIGTYIVDLGVMRETLPALNTFLVALVLTYLALLVAYHFMIPRYYDVDNSGDQYATKFSIYSVLALFTLGALLQISFDREDPGIWSGEPISNLFLDYIPMFEFDPTLPNIELVASQAQQNQQQIGSLQKPNIVIIMVDALRADHLKTYGYQRDTSPFLSELSADGELVSVQTMHSTCSESACGILSVLSGKEYADIRSNSTHLGNILGANGYTSSFIVTGNHAWGGLRSMYDADFLSDGESRERYSVNDDAGIIDELEKLNLSASQPSFLYFHLYSAHELGLRHRQFNQFEPYQASFNPITSLFSNEQDRHQQEINNYDNGILQADFFIAQIFAQLEQQGILQNSIVYITSDHGEGFGEHGHYGHTRFLYEEHTRIPLFIYDPLGSQYLNTEYATHIDIAPTILESLGLEAAAQMEGFSLLSPAPQNRLTRHQTTMASGWKLNLIKRGDRIYKHLWEGFSYPERKEEMLFEISSDPEEEENLIDTTLGQEIVTSYAGIVTPN